MKRNEEIEEAVHYLTLNIQDASWKATPLIHIMKQDQQITPLHIRQLISEKRRARRIWQNTRNPTDKTNLNSLNHKRQKMRTFTHIFRSSPLTTILCGKQ
jgi:hypothetical protein